MIWMKKKMNKILDTFHFSLFVYRSSVYDQLKINENCVNTELLKNAAIWHLAEIKYSLSFLSHISFLPFNMFGVQRTHFNQ